MHLARLATRVVIGGLFVGHGTQKLFGSFGGPGIEGTQQMMGAIGMHPTQQHAYAAGVTETVGERRWRSACSPRRRRRA